MLRLEEVNIPPSRWPSSTAIVVKADVIGVDFARDRKIWRGTCGDASLDRGQEHGVMTVVCARPTLAG